MPETTTPEVEEIETERCAICGESGDIVRLSIRGQVPCCRDREKKCVAMTLKHYDENGKKKQRTRPEQAMRKKLKFQTGKEPEVIPQEFYRVCPECSRKFIKTYFCGQRCKTCYMRHYTQKKRDLKKAQRA